MPSPMPVAPPVTRAFLPESAVMERLLNRVDKRPMIAGIGGYLRGSRQPRKSLYRRQPPLVYTFAIPSPARRAVMTSARDPRRLSIAIVTRDAADELAETLESVRGIADEIIVADTSAGDETRDVAKSFDARVYTAAWHEDFSALRNYTAQFCAGDFILWLDAGERL